MKIIRGLSGSNFPNKTNPLMGPDALDALGYMGALDALDA